MAFAHDRPIDKTVKIEYKEKHEAQHDREICHAFGERKAPHDYQYDIVQSVAERIKPTSARRHVIGEKRREYRKRAYDKVSRAERAQYKIKRRGNACGKRGEYRPLFGGYPVDPYFVFLIRIFYPGYKRDDGYRQGHSEISYHFSVIAVRICYHTVEHAENYRKHLPYRIAFGNEQQRGNAYERPYQIVVLRIAKNEKADRDRRYADAPYYPLYRFDALEKLLQSLSFKKDIPPASSNDLTIRTKCLKAPTDTRWRLPFVFY